MAREHLGLAALIVCAAAAGGTPAAAQSTVATASADRFVDSVGVNIHLHYNGTAYREQFPLIKSRLIELGVRHVRDGLEDTTWQPYYQRHNELGEEGIKGTFITSPEQSRELWIEYPSRVSRSFEAYEAPNEYDRSRKANWVQILRDTLVRLRSLRDEPRVADFPLYGPSLTTQSAFNALGDVSAYVDYANLHNYYSGRHPGTVGWGANGYGSLAWNLGLSGRVAAGKPTVATETGYQDSPTAVDPVPPEIAGRYMPRLLLEHFRGGITRTFIYELCDFPKSGGYGLLNQDVSPKPAFTAVKRLLNLLSDPGPAYTPQDLRYTILGNEAKVRHMSFQKRTGRYYLALWLSEPSWDPTTRRTLDARTQPITVSFTSPMRIVRTHRWQQDGSTLVDSRSSTTSSLAITLSDSLTIVEMLPPGDGKLEEDAARRGGGAPGRGEPDAQSTMKK